MRLRRFELLRYGHFTDRAIDFGDSRQDLHLIIGPNEAGKSTMLNGLADLLFGIAANSTYGFKHDYQAMRLGGVVENPSGQLAFVRRKGNRNTLLDPNEAPLPDDALAPFTGGADRALFERMFGLDHIRLREGGQAILEARDDVGKMLFEASSGIANLGDELRRL
ncbi:MAG: AAA family ATPase, partial [Rhodospirillaceae bacterium]|nr:AAA family ATPase [Rhodospirillaceae bacterium]